MASFRDFLNFFTPVGSGGGGGGTPTGGIDVGTSGVHPTTSGGDVQLLPNTGGNSYNDRMNGFDPKSQADNQAGLDQFIDLLANDDVGQFLGDTLTGGALSEIEAARENNRIMQTALKDAGQITTEMYERNLGIIDTHYAEAEFQTNRAYLASGAISKEMYEKNNEMITGKYNKAVLDQNKAALASGSITRSMYYKNLEAVSDGYTKAAESQQAYADAGKAALDKQLGMLDDFDKKADPFVNVHGDRPDAYTPGEFKFEITPEMQQKIDAARNAVETSASAKGLLGSSGALQKIQQDSANIAQQGIDNQFGQYIQKEGLRKDAADSASNRYTSERAFDYGVYSDDVRNSIDHLTNKYNALSGVTGMGSTAAGNIGNIQMGQSDAISGLGSGLSTNLTNINTGLATNLGNLATGESAAQVANSTNYGNNMADMTSTFGANMGNLAVNQGSVLTGLGTDAANTQANLVMSAADANMAKNNAVARAKGGAGGEILDKAIKLLPLIP
jgi:hypothetical protein